MPMQAMIEAPREADFATDDARWDAVRRRDRAAEGAFFYSVATTGVYCRPSCAARPPRRENVAFHATAAAAEAAGFRACKRCRPKEAPAHERQAALVAAACRTIETAESTPTLDDLAAEAGLSPHHFHRVFKAVAGVTPRAYAAARRRQRMAGELAVAGSVTEAIYAAGYGSSSRFYERSNAALGMTPRAYRKGGSGAVIRFAVGQCSLGAVLVAATERGVCAIQFGDDPQALVHALQDGFPQAELVGGEADFEALVARVVGQVEAPRRDFDLPLDVQGTAFQERVWRALQEIPLGETASYAEIARAIGEPRAVRAVAQACGANRVAVAIPCHRVVRTDGGLSGYRWGVERKAALIDREAAA